MLLNNYFERAFHPESIAIVGVSDPSVQRVKKVHSGGLTGGLPALRNLMEHGYSGRIYPVNPRASEILGYKAYPSISALPERADLVIVTVPAPVVPQVLRECIAVNMLNVHVMTSGFGETQQEDGMKLQEEIREIAIEGGLRLIGPNCMGLQVPSANMTTFNSIPLLNGSTAFVSQSGTLVGQLMGIMVKSRIGFSKLISYGNAVILDTTDFIEYLAKDNETSIISMYLEGINDGRRLLDIVRKTNPHKPFIIWKVGLSDSSARAARSHSGMLGGGRQIWEAFFRQTGAVSVNSIEELSDMIMTFLYMKPPKGKNAAVFTAGGGTTVAAGETCDKNGITAPVLNPETKGVLMETLSLVNQGVANPLDLPDAIFSRSLFKKVIPILANDQNIDFILMNLPSVVLNPAPMAARFADCICELAEENLSGKPLAVSLNFPVGLIPKAETDPWVQQILDAGIPVYDSLGRACKALSSFIDYHNRFSQHQGDLNAGK